MSMQGLDLFQLLPAVYRVRDTQLAQSLPLLTPTEAATLAALQLLTAPFMPPLPPDQQALFDQLTAKASRGPLESLLMVIQEQLCIVSDDLDQLYDDQFIETCARWVIPYIGDLIGYQSVRGIAPSIDNPRAEVANTISFRRRKGTVLVMEQLARDATAWGAHAVEFFRVLADTQYMNHIRLQNHYAPDVRNWKAGLYIETGFDRTAHKVDVRRIASVMPTEQGRYNIQNIGIFLWSLGAWSITNSPATPSAANAPGNPECFRFSSLGMDIPLFHKALSQGTDITDPARPNNVPDRLRRRVLCDDIQRGVGAGYYGPGNSLVISINGQPLNPYEIQVCDLAGAEGAWANTPVQSPFAAAIDPELGRLALPATAVGTHAPTVEVSYEYGFNADLGGGEYARASGGNGNTGFLVTDPAWIVPFPDTATAPRYTDLQGAIDFAIGEFAENGLIAVEITGSQIYSPAGQLLIDLPAGTTLELRAADGARPTLLLEDEIVITGDASSTAVLNGLLIAAAPATVPATPSPVALVHAPALLTDGSYSHLGQLNLTHCTLVPGWSVNPQGEPLFPTSPTLLVEPAGLQVIVARSILGPVRATRVVTFSASDTILDATTTTGIAYSAPDAAADGPSGGELTLVGCTVIGKVHAILFTLISDSIFWAWLAPGDTWAAPMIADRKQAGCVRFSYLPIGAITPRRFQCVEKAPGTPQPLFFALRYGHPGYGKLLATTNDRIRRGADDGGEMGVFHYLLGPLRETDLRIRMQEYLPVGMEFGLIYQN
ncbi:MULTISPECIES: hypothetical protein [Acidobacteriaceae]|uniref:hypothetical protein n=1 Tax=Acidobacteriaceae TaxID=204434 RepID=UPI0020B1602D|nr:MULTISPECIES: hypothetical protein [Acidobacteriaceae]MDW5265451.1 hypothetical protein [Edaphobacter sp.]